jgi:16S rRNA (cytosine1402-N4)-methyltransferase
MQLRPGLIVVDGTVGAGGHSREMLKILGQNGRLIGLDRDPMMLGHAARNLIGQNVVLKQASYVELPGVLRDLHIERVDRILLDLGLSSDQLSDEKRGFGFSSEGPLDLRFDTSIGRPAYQILAEEDSLSLERIFREYGEEPQGKPLAEFLVQRRLTTPIRTGAELATAVSECPAIRRTSTRDKHPATRVFQALRIAANDELNHVRQGISTSAYESLNVDGLLAVISFHSLEDRLVKNEFQNKDRWESLTAKPIVATPQEQRFNPRSRSARLRVARKRPGKRNST